MRIMTISSKFLKQITLILLLVSLPACKQVSKKMTEEIVEQTSKKTTMEVAEQGTKTLVKSAVKGTIVRETKHLSQEEIKKILSVIPAKPSFWKVFSKNYSKKLEKILSQLDSRSKPEIIKFLKSRKNIKIFVDDFGKNQDIIRILNAFPEKGVEVYSLLAKVGFGANSALLEWLNNFERRVVRDKMADIDLYRTLVLEKTKSGGLLIKSEKYPVSEILFDGHKMIAKAGGKGPKGGPVNDFLNTKRIPNMEYDVDGIVYKTDKLGRTASITGEITPSHMKNRPIRNEKDQTASVERMGGRVGSDQGGHGLANQLGGPNEDINLTPMARSINNGEYKRHENIIAKAVEKGKSVKVNIQNVYKNGDESLRPIYYVCEYVIDGKLTRAVIQNA